MRRRLALALAIFATACTPAAPETNAPRSLELVDSTRGRSVPVIIYGTTGPERPLAILFHGHGGTPDDYDYLAEALVERGFLVAAIDHELPGDGPLPYGEDIVRVRTPLWRQGTASALFAMRELRARGLVDRRAQILLVGHSHGGDIAIAMAAEHPRLVRAAFSLDHARMPIPRRAHPRFCSIRANDTSAAPGVLPTATEARASGIQITRTTDVTHAAMNDSGSPEQHAQIVAALDLCLG